MYQNTAKIIAANLSKGDTIALLLSQEIVFTDSSPDRWVKPKFGILISLLRNYT